MMRQLVLTLLLTVNLVTTGGDWSPFLPFMGSWSGTRTTSSGKVAVTRDYEPVDNNQRLLVSDRVGSSRTPWGLLSFDSDRGSFVLRRFAGDGSTADLVLKDVTDGGATLVFDAGSDNGGNVERITHERHGSNEFVERVESGRGTSFTLVSETQFRRKK